LKTRIHSPAPLEQAPLLKATLKYLSINEICRLSLVSKTWASAQRNLMALYSAKLDLGQSLTKGKFYLWQGRNLKESEIPDHAFHKFAPLVRHVHFDDYYDPRIFDFSKLTNVQAASLWSSVGEKLYNPSIYHLLKQVEELTIINFLDSLPQNQWSKAWYVSAVSSWLSRDVTKFAPSIKALHLECFPDRNVIISPQIKALWISGFDCESLTFIANVQSIAIFVIDIGNLLRKMMLSDKEKEEVVRKIPQFQQIQQKIDEMAGLKMLIVIRPFRRVPKSVKLFDTPSATKKMQVDSFTLKDLKKMLDNLE